MKISNELISQLSTLAKLEFKEGDFFAIKKDLKKILAFIKVLDKLDVSDVEPLSHISTEINVCLLYTSPSPRDRTRSRMPSSA